MSSTTTLGRTVRFLAEKPGLRVIRRSQGEKFLPTGQVVPDPTVPEIDYQFDRGALEVREGQDMIADVIDPDTGEIVERDAVAFIRAHDWFGVSIHEVPQDAAAPDPGVLYGEIAALAAAGDVDGLAALGDQEFQTWGREAVLTAISGAISTIEQAEEKRG